MPKKTVVEIPLEVEEDLQENPSLTEDDRQVLRQENPHLYDLRP